MNGANAVSIHCIFWLKPFCPWPIMHFLAQAVLLARTATTSQDKGVSFGFCDLPRPSILLRCNVCFEYDTDKHAANSLLLILCASTWNEWDTKETCKHPGATREHQSVRASSFAQAVIREL